MGLKNLLQDTNKNSFTQTPEAGGKLMEREDIDPQYTWNLKDIFKDEKAWEEDFKWIEETIKKFDEFRGKLGKSSSTLLECLQFADKVGIKFGRIVRYAHLNKDLNLSDTKYQALYDRAATLQSKIQTAVSFINPEILSIPDYKLKKFLMDEKGLKLYKHKLEDLLRTKKHTLPAEQEKLMALAGPVENIPYDTFGYFVSADTQFPKVKNEEGNEVEVTHGRYYAALESTDRQYRERVYKAYYSPYINYKNTLASLFNGNLKGAIFNAKARNYTSTREAALNPNNIPLEVYDNLVNTVTENLQPLHRWAGLKKKVLGLDDLHAYDTYVTLFPSVQKKYTYEEGKRILLEALKPLGDDYLSNLKTAFENRWIDVYETKGKRSGAYSSGVTFGFHPFVLLNWNYQLNDVFTFAHEMGHNMHSFYTEQSQPYPYADYSIFVAEVASTMNEALLLDYLIDKAETKEEKLALIETHLNNITTTFYRQARFAEFEQIVNEKTENGEALTPDKLSEMYEGLYQKYWGSEMTVDEEESFTWARIPHFYYNFYVYQYATSFAASEAISAKVKKEGKPAIEKYLKFLKAGSSKYPIDILKEAGVDMTTPEPILAVTKKMNKLLDDMEKLLKEK